jgi:hypothetical protein
VSDSFNPYREWLGLEQVESRPDHYTLLGLERFERDQDKIVAAADAAMSRVRKCRPGQNGARWAALLDELTEAKRCLAEPVRKAGYDDDLRERARAQGDGPSSFAAGMPFPGTAGPAASTAPARPPQGAANNPFFPPGMGANAPTSLGSSAPQSAPANSAPSSPSGSPSSAPGFPWPPSVPSETVGGAPGIPPAPMASSTASSMTPSTSPPTTTPAAGHTPAPADSPSGAQPPWSQWTAGGSEAASPSPQPPWSAGQDTSQGWSAGQCASPPWSTAQGAAPAAPRQASESPPWGQPYGQMPQAAPPGGAPWGGAAGYSTAPGMGAYDAPNPPATMPPANYPPAVQPPSAQPPMNSPWGMANAPPQGYGAVPYGQPTSGLPDPMAPAMPPSAPPMGGMQPAAPAAYSPPYSSPMPQGAYAYGSPGPPMGAPLESRPTHEPVLLGAVPGAFATAGPDVLPQGSWPTPAGGPAVKAPTESSRLRSRTRAQLPVVIGGVVAVLLLATAATWAMLSGLGGNRHNTKGGNPIAKIDVGNDGNNPTTPTPQPRGTDDPSMPGGTDPNGGDGPGMVTPPPMPPENDPPPRPRPPRPMPPMPAPEAEPMPPREELVALGSALTKARQALADRNLEESALRLAEAEPLAKRRADKELVQRLRTTHDHVKQFWGAVAESMANFKGGEKLQINNTEVTVEESTGDLLSIRLLGALRRYERMKLPGGLAVAVARASLPPDSPAAKAAVAAFMTVDPLADKDDARQLWQEASSQGGPLANMAAVLDDKYDLAGPGEPPPTPTPDPNARPTRAQLAQLGTMLKTARRALGERNFDVATAELAKAEALAKDPEHKAKVERLKMLHGYVVEFWNAVAEGLKGFRGGGTELKYKDTLIAVVEASPNHIIIRSAGENRRFDRLGMPGGLAMAVADTWFNPNAASTKVFRGAFYAVEPGADVNEARRLWQEAALSGTNTAPLLPVLADTYDFEREAL